MAPADNERCGEEDPAHLVTLPIRIVAKWRSGRVGR
jgi:hypothetical protein